MYIRTIHTYIWYFLFVSWIPQEFSCGHNSSQDTLNILYVHMYVCTYEQPTQSTQHIKAHTTQAKETRASRTLKLQQGTSLSRSLCSSRACGGYPLGMLANHPRAWPLDPLRQWGIKSFLPFGPLQECSWIKHLHVPCKDDTCSSGDKHRTIAIAVLQICLAWSIFCWVLHWGKLCLCLIVM